MGFESQDDNGAVPLSDNLPTGHVVVCEQGIQSCPATGILNRVTNQIVANNFNVRPASSRERERES